MSGIVFVFAYVFGIGVGYGLARGQDVWLRRLFRRSRPIEWGEFKSKYMAESWSKYQEQLRRIQEEEDEE